MYHTALPFMWSPPFTTKKCILGHSNGWYIWLCIIYIVFRKKNKAVYLKIVQGVFSGINLDFTWEHMGNGIYMGYLQWQVTAFICFYIVISN